MSRSEHDANRALGRMDVDSSINGGIVYPGKEPKEAADVPPHRELLKGMLLGFSIAAVGAILGIVAGTAIYLKSYF